MTEHRDEKDRKATKTQATPSDDPSVCKRCALQGPTCCQLVLGNEENCFPLSLAEKERIQSEVEITGGFAMQENTKAFIDSVCRLFPGEEDHVRELFPVRKFHFRLAIDKDGNCKFLGSGGCVISAEARPYYCRLFPVWMSGERITFFNSLTCLARKEAVNQKSMLASVFTTAAKVRDLMGRLRLVWGLPPKRGMKKVQKTF